MTTGQKIYSLRKARGMSQEDLAHRTGVSRQAVSKWENDTAAPTNDNLVTLAEFFGVGVSSFLDDDILTAADKPRGAGESEEQKGQTEVLSRQIERLEKSVKHLKTAALGLFAGILALSVNIGSRRADIKNLKNTRSNYSNTVRDIWRELNSLSFLTGQPDSYSDYYNTGDYSFSVEDFDYSTSTAKVNFRLMPHSYSLGDSGRFVVRNGAESYSFDAVLEADYYTAQGEIACPGTSENIYFSLYFYLTDRRGNTKCYPLQDTVDFAQDWRFSRQVSRTSAQLTPGAGRLTVDLEFGVDITYTMGCAVDIMALKIYPADSDIEIFKKDYSITYDEDGFMSISPLGETSNKGAAVPAVPADNAGVRVVAADKVKSCHFEDRINETIKIPSLKANAGYRVYLELTDKNGYTTVCPIVEW